MTALVNQGDRYPLQMTHPSFAPAVLSEGHVSEPPGRPARYPPVVVNTPDQEEYHVSRGYRPQKPMPKPEDDGPPAFDPKLWPRWETPPGGKAVLVKTPTHFRELFGVEFGEPIPPPPPPIETSSNVTETAAVDPALMAEFLAWKALQERRQRRQRRKT